jgi:hypothetical protein
MHRIPVVMETSDRGMIDIERFDLEPDRPIFHGLIPEVDPAEVKKYSGQERLNLVLTIIGQDTMSERGRASMREVGRTITTWPQLASSVVLGGAVGTDVCRRISLDIIRHSGRYYVDLDEIVG